MFCIKYKVVSDQFNRHTRWLVIKRFLASERSETRKLGRASPLGSPRQCKAKPAIEWLNNRVHTPSVQGTLTATLWLPDENKNKE